LKNKEGHPIPNYKYKLTRDDGTVFYGKTNEKGETYRIGSGNVAKNLTFQADDRED
jgi:type VI secretion system secreted protein VgrG